MNIIRKNRKRLDCGVVAAYNIAAWTNKPLSYRKVEELARSCGYSPKKGIYFFQFANLVKKMDLPAKRVRPKSFNDIETRLHRGKLFVFLYTPRGEASGHAVSAFVDDQGIIRLVNPEPYKQNWFEFAMELTLNGVKNFTVYEIPHRSAFL